MTAARFLELKSGNKPISDMEALDYKRLLLWEKRSAAAKRAVVTKRATGKIWPSRSKAYKESRT